MPVPYFKEFSIVLNYSLLAVGVHFWEWSPFIVFLSFVVEYVAVLMFYVLIISISKSVRTKREEIANIIGGGLTLGVIEGFFVILIGTSFDPAVSHGFKDFPLAENTVLLFIPLFLFNLLLLVRQPITVKFISVQRKRLFFVAIGLICLALMGMLLLECFSQEYSKAVLYALIFSRVLFELISHKYQKIKS